MTEALDIHTARGFLTERRDLFHVSVVPGLFDGWDVVLRIDGTYADRPMAEAAAEGMREWMRILTDVPRDGWHAWEQRRTAGGHR